MKFRFSFLIALSAALVAGCAAYYSVFGLSQLFAGASLAVIIMASSLELAKIVSVSFLQRYWSKISTSLKSYLVIGIFILVCVTSAGIYGFLSNAYQKTAHKLEISEGELAVLNSKKTLFDRSIQDNQAIINTKSTRLSQLNSLRTTQESRMDAAPTTREKNRIRNDINTATKEIEKLNGEIDALNIKNVTATDSSNSYANKAIQSKAGNSVAAEIGPLKYLAELTGKPMDKIVNWFILLLIFVFDPLAVALVIATNKMLQIEHDGDEEEKNKSPLLTPFKNILKNKSDDEEKASEIETIEQQPKEVEPELVENEEHIEETEPEHAAEIEMAPEGPEIVFKAKKEPVIPTGKIEVQDIKEIKELTNRGFSQPIPKPTNVIQRIGANKFVKNNDQTNVYFKRND